MKMKTDNLLFAILLIAALATLAFTLYTVFNKPAPEPTTGHHEDHHQMTQFDAQLAIRFMDKNGDGICDSCGMAIEQCIASGMMQCSMDANSTLGLLGSAHKHADFAVYVNGQRIDFANPSYYGRSAFFHLDEDPTGNTAPNVLHMHATGVPLWLFFQSIGGNLNSTCLSLPNSQTFCNGGNKTLRFYVNGQQNSEFGNYVFREGDKILITYGDANEDIRNQLASITNYSTGN